MNTAAMMHPTQEMSPRTMGRITAVLWLLTVATGVFAQAFVADRLVVSGDAAATATSLMVHESLYRLSFSVFLVEMLLNVATTALFYELLKPVSRRVSLLAAIFGLVACTIKMMSRLFYFAPLLTLGGAHYLGVFSAEQLQALSLLFLQVNARGAAIALPFFGVSALLMGYLIIKSGFIPRWLGALSVLGGLGWLTFIWPPLGSVMFVYVALVALVGVTSLSVWLLAIGIDERRWREPARAAS